MTGVRTATAKSTTPVRGLTTCHAPFIETARNAGELYIHQPYELYTEENHDAWRRLYSRMQDRWQRYASHAFLRGLDALHFDSGRVPRLEDVNRFLAPLTGFTAKAVSGYIPPYHFFESLRRREFPTTITIRDRARLDYLSEPDIFHDVAGHVPMHTDPAFADTLVQFGSCARTAAERAANGGTSPKAIEQLGSVLRAMARFFWFTVEFGLIREKGHLKVLGSGILSSFGEIEHSIESTAVQRFPIQLEWVINQAFEIHHYQPILFYVDSFDHLCDLVGQLESWMRQGRLDNVAPCEPTMAEEDVQSFLSGLA